MQRGWSEVGRLGARVKFAKVIEVCRTVCSKLRGTDAASARVGCASPKVQCPIYGGRRSTCGDAQD